MSDWHVLRDTGYEHWQSLLDEATEWRKSRLVPPEAPAAWRIRGATLLVRLAARLAPVVPLPAREGELPADGRV
ncbi:MAG: hypothetical protein ACTHMU_20730 [Thermomicrobiales bacterium]|jgi:hypothetical protein